MTGNQNPIVPRCRELSRLSRICKDPSERGDRVLVIVGASARAAAQSARLAGFVPAAADLFGDRDLLAASNWIRIEDYPLEVVSAVSRLPDGPWLYTGGLENYPDVVDSIAAKRPLFGNPGRVLRAVRNPFRLAEVVRRHGFHAPTSQSQPPSPRAIGRWLKKPLRSSGGLGIRIVPPVVMDQHPSRSQHVETTAEDVHGKSFYQQWIDGSSYSGVFIAAQGEATLIGATRQMVGRRWTRAPRFAYCGSIWPSGLDRRRMQELSRLGQCLAAEYRLTGLFGVDFIVAGGCMFVLEINPRYTASIEVLEQAVPLDQSIVAHHVAACEKHVLPHVDVHPEKSGRFFGKAILFADRRASVGPRFECLLAPIDAARRWTPLADVPAPGTTINVGQPMVTVRAEAATFSALMRCLKQLAVRVRAALDDPR